jgi:hypothetical protein
MTNAHVVQGQAEVSVPPSYNGPAPIVTPDGSAKLTSRRPGRELFPSSWLRGNARIIYDSGSGSVDAVGTLLEYCSTGLILQTNGCKTLVSWDRLIMVELQESA